jgi:hypothetical protein
VEEIQDTTIQYLNVNFFQLTYGTLEKDGNVTGISILMQDGTISMGIMFGKMYPVHTVLFNQ